MRVWPRLRLTHRAVWPLALTLTMNAANAHAECEASRQGTSLLVGVHLPDEMFLDFTRRAKTGLTVRLLHQVRLTRAGSLADMRTFGCQVLYDPWDEAYTVTGIDSASTKDTKAGEKIAGSTLGILPKLCATAVFPGSANLGDQVAIASVLDPVSEEQVETTRHWLAERGIGMASQSLLGRAVAALVDLKGGRTHADDCQVRTAKTPEKGFK